MPPRKIPGPHVSVKRKPPARRAVLYQDRSLALPQLTHTGIAGRVFKDFKQMLRKATLAAAAAAMIALTAAPAFAGPAETAFLQKLSNTWSGKGSLKGANSGPIACKVVFTAGGKNTKFQGRCNIPDMAQQAFSGSISYNDKTKRYESRSASGTVPGVRKGDRLIFTTNSKNLASSSRSVMTISPSSLVIDMSIVSKKGEKTTSRITFSR